jgi:hypothetical protein
MNKTINKLFDTFYFGYLSYKWKRLVRTILNVLFFLQIFFFIIFLNKYLIYLDNIKNANYYSSSSSDNDFFASFIILLIYVFLIIIISYVLEPFINKNTETKQHQIIKPEINNPTELNNITDFKENNIIKKFNFKPLIGDYLIRFIIYICIYFLHILLIVFFSIKFFGVGPTSTIGLGSILALFTSNILTKELIRKVKKNDIKK